MRDKLGSSAVLKVSSKARSGEEKKELEQMVSRGTLAAPAEGAATPGLPNPGHALAAALTLQAAEEHRVRVPHVEVVQQHEGSGAAGTDAGERSQQQPTEGPGTSGEAGIHLHLPAGEASTWTPEVSFVAAQWPLEALEYHLEVVRVLCGPAAHSAAGTD